MLDFTVVKCVDLQDKHKNAHHQNSPVPDSSGGQRRVLQAAPPPQWEEVKHGASSASLC